MGASSAVVPERIVLVNKFFHPHAGAETVFFLERELLAARGHEVFDFGMQAPGNTPSAQASYFPPERRYVGVGKREAARSALSSVYSVQARRSFARLLADARPQVVHLHNIYHQLTLSLIDAARAAGVPTVLTLHDSKIACPAYTLFRDGQVCHECVGGSPAGVVRHRCIKGSAPASLLAYAEAALARARHTYRHVDRLIAPSGFMAEVAAATGYPEDRISMIPNALGEAEVGGAPHAATAAPEPVIVFAGRLDEVKGVLGLAELFASGAVPGVLRIVGDGPLEDEIARIAAASDHVAHLGRLPREEVAREFRRARAVAIPSVWEENCPMTLLEARAAGTAVICSAIGGIPSLVDDGTDGLLVPPGDDAAAWAAALTRLCRDPELARGLADAGLGRLRRDHSPDAHYDALMTAYRQATDHAHGTRPVAA